MERKEWNAETCAAFKKEVEMLVADETMTDEALARRWLTR